VPLQVQLLCNLGLAGTAFYAAVVAIGVLFTVNVFRQDDPVFTETETI
jgi:hypothetical protein